MRFFFSQVVEIHVEFTKLQDLIRSCQGDTEIGEEGVH